MIHPLYENFNIMALERVVLDLVQCDEPERALLVLDNVPAYFRDNPAPEMTKLREVIQRAIMVASDYVMDPHDSKLPEGDTAIQSLRGVLFDMDVTKCRDLGYSVDVVDFGPGNYWLPLSLTERDIGYQPIGLNLPMALQMNERIKPMTNRFGRRTNTVRIMSAMEIIEHLPDTREIAIQAAKHGPVDIIHLSTPLYCFDPKLGKGWPDIQPHLRAYTPMEFLQEAMRLFPNFEWASYHTKDQPQSLRGVRKGIQEELRTLNLGEP